MCILKKFNYVLTPKRISSSYGNNASCLGRQMHTPREGESLPWSQEAGLQVKATLWSTWPLMSGGLCLLTQGVRT